MTRISYSKHKTGLRILFTNAFIEKWTGSELYIRDVATELINGARQSPYRKIGQV